MKNETDVNGRFEGWTLTRKTFWFDTENQLYSHCSCAGYGLRDSSYHLLALVALPQSPQDLKVFCWLIKQNAFACV